ncbi:MAG: hypothetical protein AAFP91_15335 [Pseudomonadota bacterium]
MFTKKPYSGKNQYKTDVFLDDRLGTGLSVDRLGVRNADDEIVKALSPKGHSLAERMKKPFIGWAQFVVADLNKAKLKIHKTDAVGEENPFHAEVCRAHCQDQDDLYRTAFILAVISSNYDLLPPLQNDE